MAEILKGAPVAAAITEDLKKRCAVLAEKGITPKAAIIRVGDKPDDLSYERAALKRFDSLGIAVSQFVMPEDCTENMLIEAIEKINSDKSIHGALMFRPLPDRKMQNRITDLLDPAKDIDGMTSISLAGVFTGNNTGFPPCTARAVIELCDHYGIDPAGKEAVVIGRSLVIGRPLSMMLQRRNATVTMCHTATRDLAAICRRADIIVSTAGHSGIVTEECVREGQIVIDVGVCVNDEGKITGDVDFDPVSRIVAAITPVPGGVGAITTAVLAKHVVMGLSQ